MTTAVFRRKLERIDLERMNLPEDLWYSKVDRVLESVRPAVARYLWKIDRMVEKGIGLLIFGPKGSGKSSVSSLVAKEARSRGRTVLFVRVWELREMLRSRIYFDDDTTMIARAREVDVLVLDDLREEDGREKFFPLSEIEQLVSYRGAKRKVTIVTTSLSKKSPVMEKIVSAGKSCMVPFPLRGPDLHERRQQEMKRTVFGD